MNPLTDGLFMLRLQLGIAPVTAASGIALNAPRNTIAKGSAVHGTALRLPRPTERAMDADAFAASLRVLAGHGA